MEMLTSNRNISVPPIEESVELDYSYPEMKYRYFKHYYYIHKYQPKARYPSHNDETAPPDVKKLKLDKDCSEEEPRQKAEQFRVTGLETLVMIHTNKLCVVSLSPFHPIVKKQIKVIKVDFEVFGVDRLDNKVSGKGKRGAQVMGSKATICRLHCQNGTYYDVTCGARGKLVEVNERLISCPDLTRTSWGSEGYLAVVMPRLPDMNSLIACLTPEVQYQQLYKEHCGNCEQ